MEKKEEKMVLGCYASLKEDFVFKKAFASEADKELLINMLNAFLEPKLQNPITDVAIKNPYIQGQTLTSKDSILDIRCQDSAGNHFIVEMQVSRQHFFVKRAIYYLSMSIANSGQKGKDYNYNFPNTYSLNFMDFELPSLNGCEEVVQYYSYSNEDHPEMRLKHANLIFVRLPRFKKSLEECESLQDKLLFSLCHAHEFEEQPEQLRGNIFNRLFTLIKISNFSDMELDEYVSRAMFKADQKAQLECARDDGREEGIAEGIAIGQENKEKEKKEALKEFKDKVFSLLRQGYSLDEAEKMLEIEK